MEEYPKVKVIYKKSIFVELVRLNHKFLYSTRNRKSPTKQCYMFEFSEELEKDLAILSGNEYIEIN